MPPTLVSGPLTCQCASAAGPMRMVPGLALLLALCARAEGVQVGGTPRDCPQGHDYIQARSVPTPSCALHPLGGTHALAPGRGDR